MLTGTGWDPAWLALHLTSKDAPFPLHESTPWSAVQPVPSDHWLCLEADGRATSHRRWAPPDPELTLAEGAQEVRNALVRAVDARTADGGTVSSDLSGGMDSTSLTFLACQGSAQVVTYHHVGRGVDNDDMHYAGLASRCLSEARHRVYSADQAGERFAALGINVSSADAEEPYAMEPGRSRLALLARAMAGEESRVHLMGLGGDELFRPGIAYLHDLVRTRPMVGLRHVRAQRVWDRLPWSAVLRPLVNNTVPSKQIAAVAETLAAPHRRTWADDLGWLDSLRMPPWATSKAVEAAQDLLRTRARQQVLPLSRWRGQHEMLLCARSSGKAVGRTDLLFAGHGLRLAAPFLDDEVLNAALAVRPQDLLSPYRFKPLLTAAMEGILPEDILHRTTKGEYSAETRHDWQRQRQRVMQFIEQSELAQHGLIDVGEARNSLFQLHKNPSMLIKLHSTVVCEVWLRAVRTQTADGFLLPRPAPEPSESSSP
ncbi:asparagine synthase-related protein [Streptomyces celluloflavus]|uniref:asparagine synthase-related protein n=1 Tax=Streptomyces celluloflavus TaxID=58344 RepID=UPI0036CDE424